MTGGGSVALAMLAVGLGFLLMHVIGPERGRLREGWRNDAARWRARPAWAAVEIAGAVVAFVLVYATLERLPRGWGAAAFVAAALGPAVLRWGRRQLRKRRTA